MKNYENTTQERTNEKIEVLKIHVRADLYRAFRRCVWMTVYETGKSIVEIHNQMIEELLKNKGC